STSETHGQNFSDKRIYKEKWEKFSREGTEDSTCVLGVFMFGFTMVIIGLTGVRNLWAIFTAGHRTSLC
uniref:Uncharacterized protein n=1 Tax=Romanomermis culicivorax TaxID=13658 RepID=A0A915IV95_ROMCU